MTTMNTTELIDGNVSQEHLALIVKYSGRNETTAVRWRQWLHHRPI